MKSPADLSLKLTRQWENTTLRVERILCEPDAWPITLSIGKPSATMVRDHTAEIRAHIDAWRAVSIGEVVWDTAKYRATLSEVEYPVRWIIGTASEWIRAIKSIGEKDILAQYRTLTSLLTDIDSAFHPLLVRRRSLWSDRPSDEVQQALRLATRLQPGCANGLPLRALPIKGNDTKFFERNESLLLALLDVRFDGEATAQGLEAFLGAASERGHWLLVIDLDGNLLPYEQLRLRSDELARNPLPGSHLLIVENESCQHQLPSLPNTIAVLGTGFDLNWTAAEWLKEKQIAYWGDLDTWGLELLARVRKNHPKIAPLLMSQEVFAAHQDQAVSENTPAQEKPNSTLTEREQQLYYHLRNHEQGRLEQEFLPAAEVQKAIKEWRGA